MAENATLKLRNITLISEHDEAQRDILGLKHQIAKLSRELEKAAVENIHLTETLRKQDDSKISVYQYEQVKIDLDRAKSSMVAANTQLAITVADKDALHSHLVELKNSLIFVLANIDNKYEQTIKSMNSTMQVLDEKMVRV